jgi:hypothetical protein
MKIEFDIFNREFFRTLTFSLKFQKKAQVSIIYMKNIVFLLRKTKQSSYYLNLFHESNLLSYLCWLTFKSRDQYICETDARNRASVCGLPWWSTVMRKYSVSSTFLYNGNLKCYVVRILYAISFQWSKCFGYRGQQIILKLTITDSRFWQSGTIVT